MAWTYTTLKTAIQDWLESREPTFVSNLDVVIKQAEERIVNDARLPVFRRTATSPLTSGNRFLGLPSDFLAPFSLAAISSASAYSYLMEKTVEFLTEAYPVDDGTVTGVPAYWAIWDNDTIAVAPRLNATYTMELIYFRKPDSIVSGTTSWLGNNAEMALLNACLVEGYTFLKGSQDMMQLYESKYQQSLKALRATVEGQSRYDSYRNIGRRETRA